MSPWFSKLIVATVGIIFLLKGGIALLLAFWRFAVPLLLIGGGFYLIKSQLAKKKLAAHGPRNMPLDPHEVIEICPHCHQELGSCPKCRKLGK